MSKSTSAKAKPVTIMDKRAFKPGLILTEDHFKAIYEYVVKAINRNFDMPNNARLYWRNLGEEGSYMSVLYGRGNELTINQYGDINLRSQKFMQIQKLVEKLNNHINPTRPVRRAVQTLEAARFAFEDAVDIQTAIAYYKLEIATIERAVKQAIKKFSHMGT